MIFVMSPNEGGLPAIIVCIASIITLLGHTRSLREHVLSSVGFPEKTLLHHLTAQLDTRDKGARHYPTAAQHGFTVIIVVCCLAYN
jgi:hypothetical protein